MNLKTENYYWKKGYRVIIGMDEAGRGPLAGPVTAAAAIVKLKIKYKRLKTQIKDKKIKEILRKAKDSKKLSERQRETIFELVRKNSFFQFAVASVSEKIIDQVNIERATQKAMINCLKKLNLTKKELKNSLVLIDGNRILPEQILGRSFKINLIQKAIAKGDNKIVSIALASIIAKITRDRKMKILAKRYSPYKFETHKGYPTKLHLKLLKKYGACKIHRKSYKPIRSLKSCNL